MIRFVAAVLALIAVQNIPAPTYAPADNVTVAEEAGAAESEPFAMVSAGWLDGTGGIIVTP